MSRTGQIALILSPFAIIGLGHVTARVTGIWLGVWAWAPLALTYWGAMGCLIAIAGRSGGLRRWFGRPQGNRGWSVLAVLVGFIPVSILLLNYQVLRQPAVLLLWALFALINPWFEEGYWRGLMLDVTASWPSWLSAMYTTVLFTASHPFMWGVHSIANRDWMAWVSLLIMGWVWAAAYRKTGTLRYTILSHMLVDFGNLAVPVFLNLYIPPHIQ